MVLDDFIYMPGIGGLIGLGEPHLMSSSCMGGYFLSDGQYVSHHPTGYLRLLHMVLSGLQKRAIHFQASVCIMFAHAS